MQSLLAKAETVQYSYMHFSLQMSDIYDTQHFVCPCHDISSVTHVGTWLRAPTPSISIEAH